MKSEPTKDPTKGIAASGRASLWLTRLGRPDLEDGAPLRDPVRLRTLTTLRWLAVGGQLAAISSVHFVLGFPLPLGLCLAAIAASAWLNIFTSLRFSPQHLLADREAAGFIAFDIVQLCVLLGLTGGLQNPFAVLILAPVTIAASVLPLRLTVALGALAIAGVTFIGLVHFPLPWRPDEILRLPRMYSLGVWVSLSFAVAFFGAYAHRIAAEAGQMKSALAAAELALSREEQLAAIGGLAAAAAHELGTPLATIQLTAKEMSEELRGQGLLEEDARLLVSQAERCRDILGRLSNRGVASDAMMERAAVDLLVREAAAPFAERSDGQNSDQNSGPAIIFDSVGAPDAGPAPILPRSPEIIYGVRNVVENAVAFAQTKVLITARWTRETVTVAIHDDGPGFAPEILTRLGEPYVSARARARARAARRNGMGLGFFIAKTLLERTGAEVAFANRNWPKSPEAARAESGAWVSISWPRAAIEAGQG